MSKQSRQWKNLEFSFDFDDPSSPKQRTLKEYKRYKRNWVRWKREFRVSQREMVTPMEAVMLRIIRKDSKKLTRVFYENGVKKKYYGNIELF